MYVFMDRVCLALAYPPEGVPPAIVLGVIFAELIQSYNNIPLLDTGFNPSKLIIILFLPHSDKK